VNSRTLRLLFFFTPERRVSLASSLEQARAPLPCRDSLLPSHFLILSFLYTGTHYPLCVEVCPPVCGSGQHLGLLADSLRERLLMTFRSPRLLFAPFVPNSTVTDCNYQNFTIGVQLFRPPKHYGKNCLSGNNQALPGVWPLPRQFSASRDPSAHRNALRGVHNEGTGAESEPK